MPTDTTIGSRMKEPKAINLARLDDDGGQQAAGRTVTPRAPDRFPTPMIPGAREPGMLTRFGAPPVTVYNSPCTMDAATIAARQREGGGAPNQRRPPGERLTWRNLVRRLLGSSA